MIDQFYEAQVSRILEKLVRRYTNEHGRAPSVPVKAKLVIEARRKATTFCWLLDLIKERGVPLEEVPNVIESAIKEVKE